MAELVVPVNEYDHIDGPGDAPVVLVECGDFECPHCGRAYPLVKRVQGLLGSELELVYRHFPLSQAHPHAARAAEAAEAAGAQGKFWEMHDMLFEHQDALEDDDLANYAEELGLDVERFSRELADEVYASRVRKDF